MSIHFQICIDTYIHFTFSEMYMHVRTMYTTCTYYSRVCTVTYTLYTWFRHVCTRLCQVARIPDGHCNDCFVAYMQQDLVWTT